MSEAGAVVVTGAAGRLGRAVVRQLVDAGTPVVTVDQRPVDAPAGVRQHVLPIDGPDPLRPILRGARAVIHLAAIPNPRVAPEHTIFTTNTGATYAVLDAAAEAGVGRVVVASSGSILGISFGPHERSPGYAPVDEAHPVLPQDPYALSKQVDEAACAMVHRRTRMPIVALRFPTIGTAEQTRERARRVREDPGAFRRSLWAYIELRDLARAFVAALDADGIGYEVIGVAAADTISDVPTEDLLRRYHPDTVIRTPLPGTTSVWDTTKARRLLGWRPEFTWQAHEGRGVRRGPRQAHRDR